MHPEIDNITHPLMVLTRELFSSEGQLAQQQFIIDDPENITVALENNIEITHVFFYGDHAERHPELLTQLGAGIECWQVRPRTLKKVFGNDKIARVYAIAKRPPAKSLDDLQGDIGILDGLVMMGNVGAVIRSALAFDIGGLVLLDSDIACLYDRRLIRASKGYLFKLPILQTTHESLLTYCKKNNIKLVNCSHDATQAIAAVVDDAERLAFVLGAEKTGVSETIKQQADLHAQIPYNEAVESLNVSVAAAIIFYSRYLSRINRQ